MNDKIKAPWTPQQVAALNQWQTCGHTHLFTCGNNRSDSDHVAYASRYGGDTGQLVATESGWVCPSCDYKQDWAHDFMFVGAALPGLREVHQTEDEALIHRRTVPCRCQDRIQAALPVGTVPSSGHDWVDEIIGLYRVVRQQRDGAWVEIQRMEKVMTGNTVHPQLAGGAGVPPQEVSERKAVGDNLL